VSKRRSVLKRPTVAETPIKQHTVVPFELQRQKLAQISAMENKIQNFKIIVTDFYLNIFKHIKQEWYI